MAELVLTQAEGDALLSLEKIAVQNEFDIDLPDLADLGGTMDFSFISRNRREEFILNYRKDCINLSKRNHNFRGRKVIGVARLDLDGPPHRNPNGEEVSPRHLHLYREGYGLKWAFEIPADRFKNLDDSLQTLEDFMRYCNIVDLPRIRRGLFS